MRSNLSWDFWIWIRLRSGPSNLFLTHLLPGKATCCIMGERERERYACLNCYTRYEPEIYLIHGSIYKLVLVFFLWKPIHKIRNQNVDSRKNPLKTTFPAPVYETWARYG